ncbi:2-keto-4-pentenoate hydratase [Falsiroseomonas oryzae]|uniref:2-keto-4-pentenoate hydratase n=1 Tax=Falsiroseomonas oryzae TaxID=2766473 RepID=UPI0022EA847A|nr:fumarylacetoacetate hydrolase family protein [Roseomonas sp. MO-31]
MTFPAEEAAQLLLEIRRTRTRPAGLPPDLAPRSVEQAYAIQDLVVSRLGGIGGWKIVHPAAGAAPRCSPIPASEIMESGASIAWDALLWPEVEVELAVVIGRDLPPRSVPYEPKDLRRAIAYVTGAFELLGSRFADRTAVSRTESLADLLSSAGVVKGDGTARFETVEFADVAMSLTFDDTVVGAATGGPSTADVLGTLAWLANHACDRTGGLRAGQVVITGARIHPLSLPSRGARLTAHLAGIGQVEASIRGPADNARQIVSPLV